LNSISQYFQSLRRLWILDCDHFHPEVLAALPAWLLTVDFDGQLYFRGRAGPALKALSFPRDTPWLVESEMLLR
jgi:hypothetical protein